MGEISSHRKKGGMLSNVWFRSLAAAIALSHPVVLVEGTTVSFLGKGGGGKALDSLIARKAKPPCVTYFTLSLSPDTPLSLSLPQSVTSGGMAVSVSIRLFLCFAVGAVTASEVLANTAANDTVSVLEGTP